MADRKNGAIALVVLLTLVSLLLSTVVPVLPTVTTSIAQAGTSPDVGYAVIVCGSGEGWSDSKGMSNNTKAAYDALSDLGFGDDRICYLNCDAGQPGVDMITSRQNFINAMDWVKQRVTESSPFVFYICGHSTGWSGGGDVFLYEDDYVNANSTPPGSVGALGLDYYLGTLPAATRKLVVIDSCFSGSFITTQEGTISGPNRIIITSAREQDTSWTIALSGSPFSNHLWSSIGQGKNVRDAFVDATEEANWLGLQVFHQFNPWLDDNGDGVGHEPSNLGDDGSMAANMILGQPESPPVVGEGAPNTQLFTTCYSANGGNAKLGNPINKVHRWENGYIQDFRGGEAYQGAIMLRDGTGFACAVYGSIWAKYVCMGGAGGPLGYPQTDELEGPVSSVSGARCRYNKFIGGSIVHHATGSMAGLTVFLGHGIFNKWAQLGYGTSFLGLPTSDEEVASPTGAAGFTTIGKVCSFEDGQVYWHDSGKYKDQAFITQGAIDTKYQELDGSAGRLGFPVSDEFNWGSYKRSNFEGGYIYWIPYPTNQTVVHYYTDDLCPDLTVPSVNTVVSAQSGDYIAVSWIVRNVGKFSSGPFTTLVSLSTAPGGTLPYHLDYFPMDSISAEASRPDTQDIQIPQGVPAGNYYVTVYADVYDVVNEPSPSPSGEYNNIGPTQIYIGTPSSVIGNTPNSLSFSAVEGAGNPASRTLSIWNAGGGTLAWTVQSSAIWLSLAPPSGSSTGETDTVTVSPIIAGMTAGVYDASITISASGAASRTVPVTLTVIQPQSLAVPTLYEPSCTGPNYLISWSGVSGATSYVLQEDDSLSFTSPTGYQLAQTSKWFEGKPSGTYYYRVKALCQTGESAWSNLKIVAIYDDYSPGEVTNMTPQDGVTNQPLTLTLHWSASHPTGEDLTYDVFLMPLYSDSLNEYHIVSYRQTGNSYTTTNLQYNTTYTWGIRVWDETGDERVSSVCHFTTIADTAPPTSCSININNGAATTDTYFVTLYLSASDAGSGVQYMRFSNDGQNWTWWEYYASHYPWNIADYDYGGRSGQTTYTVYVQFRDEQGNESAAFSDTISKVTAAPGNIVLNGVNYETVRDAMAAAQAGDTVYLTEGTYTIWGEVNQPRFPSTSVGIVLKPGVTLNGAGADRTRLVLESGLHTIVDADNSVVEGLTIVMADPNGARYAVYMVSNSSEIRNCVIQSTDVGIGIWGGSNNRITNNVITSCQTAIYVTSGTNTQILNNTLVNNALDGITSNDATAQVKNNIIAYNNNFGVYINSSTDFRNNNVFGNHRDYPSDSSWLPNQTGINGNTSADPLLTSAYRLNPGSPAINAGINVGIPYNGGAPDMGAFEYGAVGTLTVTSTLDGASFTISGPQNYTGSGRTWSVSNAPIGLYSITFQPISLRYTPRYEVKALMSNQTVVFDGTYAADTIGPSGTVLVNFGEYATGDSDVTIALSFADEVAGLGSGAQMMFSNDGVVWSSPEPFSSLKPNWSLLAFGGNADPGTKTVYVKVSDALGNWMGAPATEAILFVPNRQRLEVPTQYGTIQAAIDAAQPGDIVQVLPGDYQVNLVVKEGVRLQGSGPAVTSLNRNDFNIPVVTAANDSQIDGFTINKQPWMSYIGIQCAGTSPIISNCIIRAAQRGIQITGSGQPTIRNNVFSNCLVMAIAIFGTASATIENNTIVSNPWGIYLQDATSGTRIYVVNNVIANTTNYGIIDNAGTDPYHRHIFSTFNLFWQNASGDVGGYDKDRILGAGDTNADPRFVDPATANYRLQVSSPAINSGNPGERYNDPNGTRNDRGAFGGPVLNTPPVAGFSLNFAQGSLATVFVFDASASNDGECDPSELSFRWDWDGDGVYDTDASNIVTADHQYDTLGTKTVTLRVRDRAGFVSVASMQVVIVDQEPNAPHDPWPSDASSSAPVDVTLTWSCEDPDLGDNLAYDVYLGADSELNLQLVSLGQATTTYVPGTLAPGRLYFWKIVATDSHGQSSLGPVWSFSTGAEPHPNPPSVLQAEFVEPAQIIVVWADNSGNETGFRLERKIGAQGVYAQICTLSEGVTLYSDTDVMAGFTYYYRVYAFNSSGDSTCAEFGPVATPGETFNNPPDAPGNLWPPDGEPDIDLEPTLQSSTFYDPDGDLHAASQWQIRTILGDYLNPVFDSGADPSNLTSITVPSGYLIDDGTTYYWRVRYQDSQGAWSDYSTETSFTTLDTVPPPVPTLLYPANGTNTADHTPWLDWTDVTDPSAVHYQLQVDDSADFSSPEVNKTWVTASYYTLTAGEARSDGTYYWRVRAVDGVGNTGDWTSAWSFRVDTVAAAPSLVSPTDGKATKDNTPFLDWSTVSDPSVIHYQVQVDDNSDFSSPVVSKTWVTASYYTLTAGEARSDGTYYWRVRAVDALGNTSAWTTGWSFRVDTVAAMPSLVSPTNGKYTKDSTPFLDWSTVSDPSVIHYQVQVDDNSDFSSPVLSKTWVTASYYTLTAGEARSDGTYYWRVRAVDALGNVSDWTTGWSFTVDTVAPAVPSLVSPGNGTNTNDTTPWLDWSTVTDPSGVHYQVQVDDNSAFSSPAVSKTWVTASNYTLSAGEALSTGTYYYRVRAIDGAGNASAWTTGGSFNVVSV